jgi:hypothetical protein
VKTHTFERDEEIECEDEKEKVNYFCLYIAFFRKTFTEINQSGKHFPKFEKFGS